MSWLQDTLQRWRVPATSSLGKAAGLEDYSTTAVQEAPKPQMPAWRSPSTIDIADATNTDWQQAQLAANADYSRYRDTLGSYAGMVDKASGGLQGTTRETSKAGKTSAEDAKQALLEQSRTASAASQGRLDLAQGALLAGSTSADEALRSGIASASELLESSLSDLKTAGGKVDASLSRVYDQSAKAMSAFRDQSAKMIGSWSSQFKVQTEETKKATAARLAQQGYTQTEIQSELGKLDWQAGVQTASKMMEYQTEEQKRGDELRLAHTQILSTAEQAALQAATGLAAAGVQARTTAAGQIVSGQQARAQVGITAASQQAQLHQLGVQVDQWSAGVAQSAIMGALDAGSRYDMAQIQAEGLSQQMQLQGYGDWANLQLGLSQPYLPYSPVLMSMFGLNTMLQDRNAAYEGGGIEMYNAGLGMYTAATGSMLSQLRNANTSEASVGGW